MVLQLEWEYRTRILVIIKAPTVGSWVCVVSLKLAQS